MSQLFLLFLCRKNDIQRTDSKKQSRTHAVRILFRILSLKPKSKVKRIPLSPKIILQKRV